MADEKDYLDFADYVFEEKKRRGNLNNFMRRECPVGSSVAANEAFSQGNAGT